MENTQNIIKWLIEKENYDMSENIEDLATDFLKDHTMLDLINLISDYNKFVLYNVSSRLPFYEELDNMCKHYIETTEREDKDKWHDNTMADKVKHWCRCIKTFAKENDY